MAFIKTNMRNYLAEADQKEYSDLSEYKIPHGIAVSIGKTH
jgi:hypothetical protein